MVHVISTRVNDMESIRLQSSFGLQVMYGKEAKTFIEECASAISQNNEGKFAIKEEDLPQKYRFAW